MGERLSQETIERLKAKGISAELLEQVQDSVDDPLGYPERNVRLTEEGAKTLRTAGASEYDIQRVADDWDGSISGVVRPEPDDSAPKSAGPTFDRREYMRQYMAAKRAGLPRGERGTGHG